MSEWENISTKASIKKMAKYIFKPGTDQWELRKWKPIANI